jgi:hypothetical protein
VAVSLLGELTLFLARTAAGFYQTHKLSSNLLIFRQAYKLMILLDVTPECCCFQSLIDNHIGEMKYKGGGGQWILGNMTLAVKAVTEQQT